MKYLKAVFELIRDTGMKWSEDKASIFAAALAYYTLFSLAPILVLVVAIANRVLQQANVQELILNFAAENLGAQVTDILAGIMQSSAIQNSSGLVASIVSIGVLIWGATGIFNHLKRALNTIWGVEPELPTGLSGVIYFIKTRSLAFMMILGIGFLLIITVLFNTILTVVNGYLAEFFPAISAITESGATNWLVSVLMPVLLFAVIFKALPDAWVAWRDVWLGAVVTAVLFAFGNYLIGIYLRFSSVASAYGAAGSLIVTLVWIYYSAQIFFFGAEFTQVFANRYGSKVRPADNAIAVVRQRIEEEEPHLPEPPPLYLDYEPLPPIGDSPTRQKAKQVGYGLLGLAAGLMVGFIASLRRD